MSVLATATIQHQLDPIEVSVTDRSGEVGVQWAPGRVADLAVAFHDGYALLDQGNAEVVLVSKSLAPLRRWGRKGQGPGEFVEPVAISASADGDSIWVLDAALRRLTVFDRHGTYLTSIHLTQKPGGWPVDLALGSDGTLFVAYLASHERIALDPENFGILVGAFSRDGSLTAAVVSVTEDELVPPRFVTPGITHIGLTAREERLAVFFPQSGVVDVYRHGLRETTVSVCMPDEVRAAYDRQREQAQAGKLRGQQWISLVSDVQLDPEGAVVAIGGIPEKNGRYHIDRFTNDGNIQGSIVWREEVSLGAVLRLAGGTNPIGLITVDRAGRAVDITIFNPVANEWSQNDRRAAIGGAPFRNGIGANDSNHPSAVVVHDP